MSKHIEEVREQVCSMLNKVIEVNYRRTDHNIHTFVGKVVKINKNSLKLEQDDEPKPLKINIGFRNVIGQPKLIKSF